MRNHINGKHLFRNTMCAPGITLLAESQVSTCLLTDNVLNFTLEDSHKKFLNV